jgi:hypothetical protein
MAPRMTSLFLDRPLLFSGTLFVVLVIAVESRLRKAVRCGAAIDQDRSEQIAAFLQRSGNSPQLAPRIYSCHGSAAF